MSAIKTTPSNHFSLLHLPLSGAYLEYHCSHKKPFYEFSLARKKHTISIAIINHQDTKVNQRRIPLTSTYLVIKASAVLCLQKFNRPDRDLLSIERSKHLNFYLIKFWKKVSEEMFLSQSCKIILSRLAPSKIKDVYNWSHSLPSKRI